MAYNFPESFIEDLKTSFRFSPTLKLVSVIFYFFHQMVARQNLRKLLFISSKKLFSLSRYSNFCNFPPFFQHFPDSKGQMKVKQFMMS